MTRALAKGPLEGRKDIKEAEARLKVEYHKNYEKEKGKKLKEAQELEERYNTATYDGTKATLNPERFLHEKFVVEKVEVTVLRTGLYICDLAKLWPEVARLGLFKLAIKVRGDMWAFMSLARKWKLLSAKANDSGWKSKIR